MKRIAIIIFLFATTFAVRAQEFVCQVSVNTSKVEMSDKTRFENMKTAIYEFINSQKWTSYQFQDQERIECSIMLTLDDPGSSNDYTGTLNVQLRRPVYKTSYNTTVLNYIDKDFGFRYEDGTPLQFIDNANTNNLSAVLAFYVYMMLGMDFDTFSQSGGSPFYDKGLSVVNQSQNMSYKGWKSYENKKNRYWFAENLTNGAYGKAHEFLYEYHRLGLDVMADNAEQGRQAILSSLEKLQKLQREKTGLFVMTLFINAKADEIVNIFSEGSDQQKEKVVAIMKEIDPSNANKYQKIIKK